MKLSFVRLRQQTKEKYFSKDDVFVPTPDW